MTFPLAELLVSVPWRPYVGGLVINTVVGALWVLPVIRPYGFGRTRRVVVGSHLLMFVLVAWLALVELPPAYLAEEHGLRYYIGFVVGVVLAFGPVAAFFTCVWLSIYGEVIGKQLEQDDDVVAKRRDDENPYAASKTER
ncbi:MAG: hypothetical protein AB8G99_07365 [Planctomycetaceae bacterium]